MPGPRSAVCVLGGVYGALLVVRVELMRVVVVAGVRGARERADAASQCSNRHEHGQDALGHIGTSPQPLVFGAPSMCASESMVRGGRGQLGQRPSWPRCRSYDPLVGADRIYILQ